MSPQGREAVILERLFEGEEGRTSFDGEMGRGGFGREGGKIPWRPQTFSNAGLETLKNAS